MILPAFPENNIPITLSSSNGFVPFLGVVLQSIYENSSVENNYDIIILHSDISEYNKFLLLSLSESRRNVSLRFVDVSEKFSGYDFSVFKWAKQNFYRLLIADIASEFKKVIYLDCDLAVNADVAELFKVDLENNYIAATRSTSAAGLIRTPGFEFERNYYINELGLTDTNDYFSNGVAVLNTDQIRKDFPGNSLLDMILEDPTQWHSGDESFYNKIFRGRVKYIPCEWNVIHNRRTVRFMDFIPDELMDDYRKSYMAPKIVHYLGGNEKPTDYPSDELAHYFWIYARHTPFYEQLIWILAKNAAQEQVHIGRKFVEARIEELQKTLDAILHERNMDRKMENEVSNLTFIGDKLSPKCSIRWKIVKTTRSFFRLLKK